MSQLETIGEALGLLAARVAALEAQETPKAGIVNLLDLPAPTELTIAAGVVTMTQSYHRIDTQSDDATDDLDTISGGAAGYILILQAQSNVRTVVAKDNVGNLLLAGDFSMDNRGYTLVLLHDGTSWVELSRSNNG